MIVEKKDTMLVTMSALYIKKIKDEAEASRITNQENLGAIPLIEENKKHW